jgi:hypothetical protein
MFVTWAFPASLRHRTGPNDPLPDMREERNKSPGAFLTQALDPSGSRIPIQGGNELR